MPAVANTISFLQQLDFFQGWSLYIFGILVRSMVDMLAVASSTALLYDCRTFGISLAA